MPFVRLLRKKVVMKSFIHSSLILVITLVVGCGSENSNANPLVVKLESVKPNMTRIEVDKLLTPDGGFRYVPSHIITYLHPEKLNYKIDITFKLTHRNEENQNFVETPSDPVISISEPYHQLPYYD